jgi:hypothetical protein
MDAASEGASDGAADKVIIGGASSLAAFHVVEVAGILAEESERSTWIQNYQSNCRQSNQSIWQLHGAMQPQE